MPCPVVSWTLPGMATLPLPLAACSNVQQPFQEEILPDVQPEPPLVQLEATSSCPVTCCHPHLATTSFQVVVESDKISCDSPFSRLNTPSSLSHSSQNLLSKPLPRFTACLWKFSSTSMRAQNWTNIFPVEPHIWCFLLNYLDVAKRQLFKDLNLFQKCQSQLSSSTQLNQYSNLVFTLTASEYSEVFLGGKHD